MKKAIKWGLIICGSLVVIVIAGLLIAIPTIYGAVVLSRAEPVDTGAIRISPEG